jgi:hypothetical protein
LDQIGDPKAPRNTISGVVKKHGLPRLFQGYDATLCREFLFGVALLGSPALSRFLAEEFVQPNKETNMFADFLDGKELLVVSLGMGMCTGFITNGPGRSYA